MCDVLAHLALGKLQRAFKRSCLFQIRWISLALQAVSQINTMHHAHMLHGSAPLTASLEKVKQVRGVIFT